MRRLQKYDSESNLHLQVCQYLRLQYPDVLFRTDFAAGLRLTPGQAAKHKRLQAGRAWPDLFIAKPKFDENGKELYCGAFFELKKQGTRLVKKNGEMVANEHYREQRALLDKLYDLGYYAEFCVGFDDAKRRIDWYLREQADFLEEHSATAPSMWVKKSTIDKEF